MSSTISNITSSTSEVKSIYRERAKPYIEETIKASNISIATEIADAKEKEGWKIVRKNRSSIRIRKPKQHDVLLEDDVWCILATMGYPVLNSVRHFTIDSENGGPPRQIDVFAKDDDTVLIIECTSCIERKRKPLNDLIAKIVNYKKAVTSKINEHFGTDPKLKIKFGIATRNIEWQTVDQDKCDYEGIFTLKDDDINYYKSLTKLLRSGARYQLLAGIFKDEEIHSIDLNVAATQGHMGGVTFYNFLIKPKDLLKIAYISHKKGDSDINTYQRMLQGKRLEKIGQYLDDGGHFPTNIVVNVKSKRPLRFDKKEQLGGSSYGTLYLPNKFATAWVIDGQHRLYGYSYSELAAKTNDDKTTFPVLAYENLPQLAEAKMFVDINCEQVRVQRNLLSEIYADLRWDSSDFKERTTALCSKIAIKLNTLSESPIQGRITTTNKHKNSYRCLTITSLVDGFTENSLFGEQKKAGIILGPLCAAYSDNLSATLEKAVTVTINYLNIFKEHNPLNWSLGDAQSGYLCTNNAIRSLMRVLAEICRHIQHHKRISLPDLSGEEASAYISEYAIVLAKAFSEMSAPDIQAYRTQQAKAGVNKNALRMMAIIHNRIHDFCPEKMIEYINELDIDGTNDAVKLINHIQELLVTHTVNTLKRQYGDQWWYDGIPESVRLECTSRSEKDKGAREKHQYLCLIDYFTIANKNWTLFSETLAKGTKGNKDDKLSWIKELNTIRNITHHREKWPASKEQVSQVRDIYKHITEKLTG